MTTIDRPKLRDFPATVILIGVNVICFLIIYLDAGAFTGSAWNASLMKFGAQFNPYTLGGEWYRIFLHMFLHGHAVHLAVNMIALFFAGRDLEPAIGTPKFISLYFLSGIGASLVSLYWSWFTMGVGASGAIFGLFGFSIAFSVVHSFRYGTPLAPLLINFAIFIFINIAVGAAFHADHAAHFGGLITGALLALVSYYLQPNLKSVKYELAFVVVFAIVFFLLPRFQVIQYRAIRQIVDAESTLKYLGSKGFSTKQYLEIVETNTREWDSARYILSLHKSVPPELQTDTFTMGRYIHFRKVENQYNLRMYRDENYILYDSLIALQDSIRKYLQLEHPVPVNFEKAPAVEEDLSEDTTDQPEMVRVWYDSDWVEIDRPGTYFRVGARDTSGRWQGLVQDHYASGVVQMKGSYKDDKRDGIFLYYSDHGTYTSAGRYGDNRSVGKWQTFHDNGKLENEVVYGNRVFYKNVWDSVGNHLVINGYGKVTEYYSDSTRKLEGSYVNGMREGIWMGWHENGSTHFKEEFNNGQLIYGRSRSRTGHEYIYDATSLEPVPGAGVDAYRKYLARGTARDGFASKGSVRLTFRVTHQGVPTDFEVEKSVSPELDKRAIELIRTGPSWNPAKLHGYQPVDGYVRLDVEF